MVPHQKEDAMHTEFDPCNRQHGIYRTKTPMRQGCSKCGRQISQGTILGVVKFEGVPQLHALVDPNKVWCCGEQLTLAQFFDSDRAAEVALNEFQRAERATIPLPEKFENYIVATSFAPPPSERN